MLTGFLSEILNGSDQLENIGIYGLIILSRVGTTYKTGFGLDD
jgi:hypothetical protein